MMVEDLQAEIRRLNDEIEELQDELASMYSPDELAERVANEVESALDDLRDDWRRANGPMAEIAHSILSDLAWRATVGDKAAQIIEAEVAPLLRLVRDSAAA